MLNGFSFPALAAILAGVPVSLSWLWAQALPRLDRMIVPLSVTVASVIFVATLTHKWTKGRTETMAEIRNLKERMDRIEGHCKQQRSIKKH